VKPEEWIGLAVAGMFPVMVIIERIWPARQFPRVPFWNWIGIALFFYTGILNTVLLGLVPSDWLATHKLFDLSKVGLLPSVLIGHMIITFVTFAWHRATHEINFLWRAFHQMHHAPRHLNVYAANVIHPTDFAVYVLVPVLIAVFILGVDPLAAAILANLGGFNAFLQHWNVRTPQWLGYFFQRPEAHCIHHQRGLHRYNYSDFPLWDMLFGTFRNPATWQGETGFDEPADGRYAAMLAFVDVNAPLIGDQSFGQAARYDTAESGVGSA
jgi:sterol desaturase/sphingolipid hydroxylase (fatty acid hydroxylase superfamily)